MKKTFTLLALGLFAIAARAQDAIPAYEPYGKIPMEELEMKACDFEKDANAEVLDSKGDVYYDPRIQVVEDRHKRIKIFNDNGKGYANIKIEYYSANNYQYVTGIQAQTVNLVNGKEEITKLDKKDIYKQAVNKYYSKITFSMPNVKAGSVIEYKYEISTEDPVSIPSWYFQDDIPVRFSEYVTNIPEYFTFSTQTHMRVPYTKFSKTQGSGSFTIDNNSISYNSEINDRIMADVRSLPDEPFMSSKEDNLISLSFQLAMFMPPNGFTESYSTSWSKIAGNLMADEDFGGQLKRKLTNEDVIITKAKALKTDDEKIAYIFNEVKNDMKWNGEDEWYTEDGTSKAWDNKTGNSTEVNLIMYHLLKKAGVNAWPMVVSTREHGKVNQVYTNLDQFNRAVVYVPVDSTKSYILDATDKYSLYNETPYNLLNSSGLYVNPDDKSYDLLFIKRDEPVRRSVFIQADIKPEGKVDGTAQISSFSYNKINSVKKYKTDGEAKFIDYLRNDDNNLKISSIKMENMDVDTLPLLQHIDFNLNLTTDDNYIYFNPNLFTELFKNPFLSENRSTDIDFGYLNYIVVNGMYKEPAGYKIDVLPKSVTMTTPDKSITFRRLVAEQDGNVVVRYQISYQKSIYFKEDYANFHEFYKKMYEMLNEQIVFKKS